MSEPDFKVYVMELVEILTTIVTAQEKRTSYLERRLAPVLWVCYNPACGAPNQIPRILFPGYGGLAATIICGHCHHVQPWDYLQQFAPSATVEPEP